MKVRVRARIEVKVRVPGCESGPFPQVPQEVPAPAQPKEHKPILEFGEMMRRQAALHKVSNPEVAA